MRESSLFWERRRLKRSSISELGGVDAILGVEWLEKLGEVVLNWRAMTMGYCTGGKRVVIQGDPALTRQLVEPHALLKMTDAESWLIIWELGRVESELDREEEVDLTEAQRAEMGTLLQKHYRVFREVQGLPSTRDLVHRIPLKEGENPVNVRPYRYPHLLKGEIERQVADMLRAGIIRPSSSPYSSPVILVQKKDKSWRFCVDYRALNRATILNKFPIPVIEELLDELRGAAYFSKIDLKAAITRSEWGKRTYTKRHLRLTKATTSSS